MLSNLFGSFVDEYEFAQIYTNSDLPANSICTNYFHLSEADMLESVLKRKSFGRVLQKNEINQKKSKKVEDKDILNIYKTNNLAVVYNNFITSFTSRGITRLLGDSLHRKRLIDEFRPWLLKNAELFRQS